VVPEVPELRIIDEVLWQAVKVRQGAHQQQVDRTATGYRLNATHRRRFLFSGALRCGVCGGGYTIVSNDKYGCANHRNKGTCENHLAIKRPELEARVFAGLKEKLLAPELVKEVVAEFNAELNRRAREDEAGYEAAKRELAAVGRKIEGILRAIEDGVYTATTKDRLLELEKRKAELEAVKPVTPMPRVHPAAADLYAKKVARLEEALNEPGAREEAAEALRTLVEEIRLTPVDGVLRVELYGELAAILQLGQEPQKQNRADTVSTRFSVVAGNRNHLYRTSVWLRR
jgi:site-specific DNA recombinase